MLKTWPKGLVGAVRDNDPGVPHRRDFCVSPRHRCAMRGALSKFRQTRDDPVTAEDRIRALPCWTGSIEIAPLPGGLSNANYLVKDAAGRHVVRFGQDYPFHHVFREREVMTSRAAHAAGFAPAVRYAEPGIMVTEYPRRQDLCGRRRARQYRPRRSPDARFPPRDAQPHLRRRLHVLGVPRHPRLCAHAGGRRQPQARATCPSFWRWPTSWSGRRSCCRSSSATTIFCRRIFSTTATGCG